MWLLSSPQPKATSDSTSRAPNFTTVVGTSSSSSATNAPLSFASASLHSNQPDPVTQQDHIASKVIINRKAGSSRKQQGEKQKEEKPWSMSSPMHVRKALHFATLRAKLVQGKGGLAVRLLLAAGLAAFLLVFAARSLSSLSPSAVSSRQQQQAVVATGECGGEGSSSYRVPAAVAEALVHYATSNTTPQQTAAEIGVSLRVLQRRAPCNFLVFGLGFDSPMWAALNHGGRTVFLEEDASWIASVKAKHPGLESYHVAYDTVLTEADALLELRAHPSCVAQPDLAAASDASCRLAMRGLPAAFGEVEWDVIMVDAPTGWTPQSPGRMSAIYTAGMAARARRAGDGPTDVFVHDVDRPVEDAFSKAFLCEGYLAEQVGRIRHFVLPSHREKDGMPFCP